MKTLPEGSATFARYCIKRNMSESTYTMLEGFGYRVLFPDDHLRRVYSCEKCYKEFGSAVPEVWTYNKDGFWMS